MSWKKVLLDEVIIEPVIDNRGRNPSTYTDSGIPVIDNFMIKGRKNINLDEAKRFIDENTFKTFIRKYIEPKDIIITLVGHGVGNVSQAPKQKAVIIQNTVGLRTNDKIVDDFLFFNLILNKEKIMNLNRGSAQPSVKVGDLKKLIINLPPLQTQKRIADILNTYDDLIENNLKRIKLLEQAAQNIYKEWFVNLRFPGYENTPINEETGLPVGWEEKELKSIVDFLGGFAFKSKTYVENGKYKVITIKNVEDKVFNTSVGNSVNSIPLKLKEHCKIVEGDILLSLTGNVGRSCIAYGKNNLLNQRVAKIKPINENWLPYVYWMFNDNKMFSLMNNLATGAAQQNLSPVKLAKEKVVIPSESIVELYCSKANSIFKQIVLLNKQNQKLKAARDILLPRLMNRTIEV